MGTTGTDILVDALIREGVDTLFGYPGAALLPVLDRLYDGAVRFVLARHEQGAAHMADGYARATGRVGVCMATSGPGATNLTTGIATAHMDSVPLVAITGQVKTDLIGNDAFQEADVTGIMRPITKHAYLVREVGELARVVRQAFHVARTGRPGPVVIDLPVDVTTAEHTGEPDTSLRLPGYKPSTRGHARQIRRAAEAIDGAARPVVYAGGGVVASGAAAELRALAEAGRLPVTTTLMGLGAFPGDHPLWLGMLGMHGTPTANHAVMGSDLIVAVGARFDDRVTGPLESFAPEARIVHIDIDPSSISKNIQVHIPVVGDAAAILRELVPLVGPAPREPWHRQIAAWRDHHPVGYEADGPGIKPQAVIEQLCRLTPDDAIIATDVGQHQMWTALFYTFRQPRTLLTSGGLGTMGYGFPAALGAQVGCPERLVACVAGDGSFQMNMQELTTAAAYGLAVKVILLNNGCLGMVRQWQELFYDRRYSQTVLERNPDFVRLAEACGATGLRVADRADLGDALARTLATDGPVVLDVHIEPEENVFPMVPAGQAIDQMIGGMA